MLGTQTTTTKKPTTTTRKPSSSSAAELRKRAEYQRARVIAGKLFEIPKPEDISRRLALEQDDVAWLRHYFGPGCGLEDVFSYDFVPQQLDMIRAIGAAMRDGADQALAASRGEGKTTIAERLAIKYVAQGLCDYVVLFGATGGMAEKILDSIARSFTDNAYLAADYPEICQPVKHLEGAPQRARSQRANGWRHDTGERFECAMLSYAWCGSELIFPNAPGSPSAGAIIATRGLDAAVRGLRTNGKRPKLAIIDDPDTELTAVSEEQAKKLERRIDAAIGGLGGQRRAVGRVILTTLQSRISVSFKLTDPTQRPTFRGRRYRYLIAPPDRMDLWEQYVTWRKEDKQRRTETGEDADSHCRRSHAFYVANRAEMDAGALVGNPNRFNDTLLADGTRVEESALQHYFNEVERIGPEAVATEYDNDPPEEESASETTLQHYQIQRKVSGVGRRIVPRGATLVTCGADVRKTEIHWVLRAWLPDATGHTIDYGIQATSGTRYGSDDGVDEAIRRALLQLAESFRESPPMRADGEIVPVSIALVDSAYRPDAVFAACAQAGVGWMPLKGFGRSAGCVGANFSEQQRATIDRKPGDGWFLSRQGRQWLACIDADRWKNWEHDRWLTPSDKPGTFLLFGESSEGSDRMTVDEREHSAYARHIVAEREVEEYKKGTLRRVWKQLSKQNHWLDASCYASVAANMKGIRPATSAVATMSARLAAANESRPTLAQLAGRK